jgi:aspartate kinase
MKLIVQKYGGATLATPEKIKSVARKISELRKSGFSVVVVVSAMGQTTNQLIELSKQVSKNPTLREMDMLISVGERISMSLLSMALNDLDCEAISFTGSQAGILTDDDHISANIIDVTPIRVLAALEKNKVVVLAGFQGVSQKTKEITTLGRGGSDITAVAMAFALKADRCEILKDVDCIFSADPNSISTARPIRNLNTDQLYEMTYWGAKVLNYKSVEKFHAPSAPNSTKPQLYIGPADNSKKTGTDVHQAFDKSQVSFFDPGFSSSVLSINSLNEAWLILENSKASNKPLPWSALQKLKTTENQIWVTAPIEILDQLRSDLNIIENLSVITLTLTEKNNLVTIKSEVEKEFPAIKYVFQSEYSIHLFCESSDKKELIKKLHSKYFE